jgi:RNA polymerase subunit RPABC4/transcription elongation factor Spt4
LKILTQADNDSATGYEARKNHPYHGEKTLTVDWRTMIVTIEMAMADEMGVSVGMEMADEKVVTVAFGRMVTAEVVMTIETATADVKALTVDRYQHQLYCRLTPVYRRHSVGLSRDCPASLDSQ